MLAIDPENLDITNHYVAQAISGGICMLGLFIAILVTCFKNVGRALDAAEDGLLKPIFLWSLGVSLAAHCTAFFSVSYFDQIQVFWYWFLAVLSCLSASELAVKLGVPDGGAAAETQLEAEPSDELTPSRVPGVVFPQSY